MPLKTLTIAEKRNLLTLNAQLHSTKILNNLLYLSSVKGFFQEYFNPFLGAFDILV